MKAEVMMMAEYDNFRATVTVLMYIIKLSGY